MKNAKNKAIEKRKMTKRMEKGHIGKENSHFHYDKNKSHYEPQEWAKSALRKARRDNLLTRYGEEILGKMK